MEHNRTCSLVLGLILASAGCGDDSGTTPPTDGGPDTPPGDLPMDRTEAGPDAPADRPDDADDGGDRFGCDPFLPDSCEAGEKCAVLVVGRGTPDAHYALGCVSASLGTRSEGTSCGQTRDATPEDTTDNVQTNNCAQGLGCFNDNARSPINRCQPLCGPVEVMCADGLFCFGVSTDPPFGFCGEYDNCDPVMQTGCLPGEGCYLIGGEETGFVADCGEVMIPKGQTGAAGDPCMFVNNCTPGITCFNEIGTGADGGLGEEALCRQICAAGGAGGGGCAGALTCVPVPMASPDIPTAPGICQ